MYFTYIDFKLRLNATFNNISVISCGQLYWWMKLEDTEVTDTLYHIMLYKDFDTAMLIVSLMRFSSYMYLSTYHLIEPITAHTSR
jgi:hypothetical protein